ncbi:MAG: hypothetical protein A3H72_00635 [Candidatus Doudnabacteria bacterium RIFCSPLOWO2_02_FULL_48_8]|nr:MAG: hypothetical protein A3H72_00635 [Candidatus Doudnabacteria bacterium RIFCSPLOWO2_02_FULL_48_8]OGE95710.1 MAG: hypothetical protein A3E98_03605 [Candidatus Doudnabacteria bacterium RIFCSPHIGHO2_12_FULL_48_11]
MPLSPIDYINRFSLEFLVLGLTVLTIFINHAKAGNDQSVIFSYLYTHPSLNTSLLSQSDATTTIVPSTNWVPAVSAQSNVILASTSDNPTTIQENVIVKTNPADTDNFLRAGRSVYEVVPGDNIISIASSFGVSPATIMMENKLDENSVLHPGQKLTVLPTTGVSHKVLEEETLEKIAAKYKVSEDDILDVNDIELPDDILAGDILVIPMQVNMPNRPKPASQFVRSEAGRIALSQANAPQNLSGGTLSFLWPTPVRTITQGFLRRHSGLDISNSTMVPIYASEAGFVELSGWQTGYGNTIVVNHGNGFKTRYGHASELYVKAGDAVAKGQTIAKQGRTGRVRGATGIHLHFEIIKNGVRVNPLSYVRP